MYHDTYRASNLSYSEQFSTKFNQIWDTFINTRYYFSIFTLKYSEICIMIRIKYRFEEYHDTYRIVNQERYTALIEGVLNRIDLFSSCQFVKMFPIIHVFIPKKIRFKLMFTFLS